MDCGYLEDARAVDGADVNRFIGSPDSKRVTGAMCTIDIIKKDCELKILIGCTQAEMDLIYNHLNSPNFFSVYLLVRE